MDTSTKLGTFSLEEEVLTEYIPKILGGLFVIA